MCRHRVGSISMRQSPSDSASMSTGAARHFCCPASMLGTIIEAEIGLRIEI
jgi:hypothetical protein